MTVLARKASIVVGVILLAALLASPAFAQTARPAPEIVDPVNVGVKDGYGGKVLYYAVVVDPREYFFREANQEGFAPQPLPLNASKEETRGSQRPVDNSTIGTMGAVVADSVSVGGSVFEPHTGVTPPSLPTTEQLVRDLRSVQQALGL